MKKAALLLLAFAVFASCKEQGIEIPPLGGSASARKVLIEEFTGVGCANCPQGAAEIENLLGLYPDNLIAVSIHADPTFTNPLPESKVDFRIPTAIDLENYLGKPLGYPSAIIDRKLFSGDNDLQAFKGQWASRIKDELDKNPVLTAVAIANSFDPASRSLGVAVTVLPNKALSGDLRLTVLITESGIVDAQDVQGEVVEDYVHNHAMRAMLTPFDGAPLGSALPVGQAVTKDFSFVLPADWNATECRVVAFAHYGGGSSKEVLQAEEAHVTN